MKKLMIVCPGCKKEFSPDQALKHYLQVDHLMKGGREALNASLSEKEKTVNQDKGEFDKKPSAKIITIIEKLWLQDG